jgi:hypothetical protein
MLLNLSGRPASPLTMASVPPSGGGVGGADPAKPIIGLRTSSTSKAGYEGGLGQTNYGCATQVYENIVDVDLTIGKEVVSRRPATK